MKDKILIGVIVALVTSFGTTVIYLDSQIHKHERLVKELVSLSDRQCKLNKYSIEAGRACVDLCNKIMIENNELKKNQKPDKN